MINSLDEAIKHCEEVAEEKEGQAWEAQLQEEYGMIKSCKECASEHRQLAKLLRELKAYREAWIPVSERLPEANKAVLVYLTTGMTNTYCVACWNDGLGGWQEWIGFALLEKEKEYRIIAWMPLPEPYKAESEVNANGDSD